jgi:ABC-type microcin C transport system permease subunit YejE
MREYKMPKGGFVIEMLSSKNATTDVGYLWRVLYYTYIALPLLVIYFALYSAAMAFVLGSIKGLFGMKTDLSSMTPQDWLISAGMGLLFSVVLFHFRILPILFIPVNLILSV